MGGQELFAVLNIPAIILLIVGIIMMIIEMFIPGFGVCGVIGIVSFVVGIFLQAKSFAEGLILFVVLLIFIIIFAVLFFRSATKGAISRSDMVLSSQINGKASISAELKVGDIGKSETPLRPAGIALFPVGRMDVLTQGDYLDANVSVEVMRIDGNRILVKKH